MASLWYKLTRNWRNMSFHNHLSFSDSGACPPCCLLCHCKGSRIPYISPCHVLPHSLWLLLGVEMMSVIRLENNSDGKGPQKVSGPNPCPKQGELRSQTWLLKALSSCIWKNSGARACTVSPGSPLFSQGKGFSWHPT